jgi:peptidoglycan/LPS O-acetylase OafA/YrhL
MSEWATYSLSDFLLFSPRTYYRLFELHNAAVWPAHLAALALGAAAALLALRPGSGPWRGRAAALVLAALWAWVARAYLLERYATINWAAEYFAWVFALEALLLLALPLLSARPLFRPRGWSARAGAALVLFALLLQPLAAPLLGRPWAQAEVFGIAPDPTAAATLGLMLLAQGRRRWLLLPIPLAWSALTGLTLWAMRSPEALLMPALGAAALALAAARDLRRSKP